VAEGGNVQIRVLTAVAHCRQLGDGLRQGARGRKVSSRICKSKAAAQAGLQALREALLQPIA
jgi:hypothetical protein